MTKKIYIKPDVDIVEMESIVMVNVSQTSGSDSGGNNIDTPDFGGDGNGDDMN